MRSLCPGLDSLEVLFMTEAEVLHSLLEMVLVYELPYQMWKWEKTLLKTNTPKTFDRETVCLQPLIRGKWAYIKILQWEGPGRYNIWLVFIA